MFLPLKEGDVPTVYKFCPNCMKARPYNEGCKTPECAVLQRSPSFRRNELAENLQVALLMVLVGDTTQDWIAVITELETELMHYNAHRSAAAFTQ